jgi:hypothetical protein
MLESGTDQHVSRVVQSARSDNIKTLHLCHYIVYYNVNYEYRNYMKNVKFILRNALAYVLLRGNEVRKLIFRFKCKSSDI